MRKITCAAALLLGLGMRTGRLAFAQEAPALSVVPTKATMLVGETRTFRAVGKDLPLAAQYPLGCFSRTCCQAYGGGR